MSTGMSIEELFERAGFNDLQEGNVLTLKDICFYMKSDELRGGASSPVLKFIILNRETGKEASIEVALAFDYPVDFAGPVPGVGIVEIEISEKLRAKFLKVSEHFPKDKVLCYKNAPTENPVILSEWDHGKFIVAKTEQDYAIVKVWALVRDLWTMIKFSNQAPNSLDDDEEEEELNA